MYVQYAVISKALTWIWVIGKMHDIDTYVNGRNIPCNIFKWAILKDTLSILNFIDYNMFLNTNLLNIIGS